VSYLAGLRISLLALLILAISLKLYLYGRTEVPPIDFKTHVTNLLREQGYDVAELRTDQALFQALGARRGSCELKLSSISLLGWERDTIWQTVRSGHQVLFIYAGSRYSDQPAWRTFFDYYVNRLARLVGAAKPLRPVVAVVASPECDLATMTWLDQAS
jgi:hypothetical protein